MLIITMHTLICRLILIRPSVITLKIPQSIWFSYLVSLEDELRVEVLLLLLQDHLEVGRTVPNLVVAVHLKYVKYFIKIIKYQY